LPPHLLVHWRVDHLPIQFERAFARRAVRLKCDLDTWGAVNLYRNQYRHATLKQDEPFWAGEYAEWMMSIWLGCIACCVSSTPCLFFMMRADLPVEAEASTFFWLLPQGNIILVIHADLFRPSAPPVSSIAKRGVRYR